MRIISGTARGTKLYTLEGMTTRPTLDRVKESIFNIIQNEIIDANFLDLFSGSGAIGLEAASRGAKKVSLCDKSKEAINIINKNIQKTHLEDKTYVYNMDYKECLNQIKNEKYDLIFLDPPYNTKLIYDAIKEILELNILKDEAKIIIETDDDKVLNDIAKQNIQIIDKRKYGRAIIVFIKKHSQ